MGEAYEAPRGGLGRLPATGPVALTNEHFADGSQRRPLTQCVDDTQSKHDAVKSRRRDRRERLTTCEADQAPELGNLPRRDGNGEWEYQPVERQRLDATRNVDADAVMNAPDDGMKLPIPGDSEAGCDRRRGVGAGRAPRGPGAQYRRIEGGRP